MYKRQPIQKTKLNINNSYIGETIEHKIQRIVRNKEPISDGAPLVFTERKDGVKAEYDIRTDRFEIAIDAMDKITKSIRAKREQKHKVIGKEAIEAMKIEEDSETKIIQDNNK